MELVPSTESVWASLEQAIANTHLGQGIPGIRLIPNMQCPHLFCTLPIASAPRLRLQDTHCTHCFLQGRQATFSLELRLRVTGI